MSVGGINVQVGVGLQSFAAGLKQGENLLKDFQKRMTNIRLDKAIKGNPFANTTKYMKEARNTLNGVFQEWSKEIRVAGNNMDNLATKSKKSVQILIQEYQKLSRQQKLFTTGIFSGAETPLKSLQGYFTGGVAVTASKGDLTKQLRQIQQLTPVFSQARMQIGKAISNINRGFRINANTLYKYINSVFGKVSTEYAALGSRFKEEFVRQPGLQYAEELRQARSLTRVQLERNDILKRLIVNEKKLRTNIQGGLATTQNRIGLYNTLKQKQELGVKFTKQETQELKTLGKWYQQTQTRANGFLSPAWFKERLVWFVQLRLAWAVWGQLGKTFRDIIDYQNQLARAMRTASSATLSQEQIAKDYTSIMTEMLSKHGVTWQQAGEALYQFGSAGLTAEESMSALNSTMKLVVGTEGDVTEVTKGIAGIYNNFKDQLTGLTTASEKFNYINGIIATVWKHHQVEISELIQGYNYLSAVGKQSGLTFKDMSALLAVLNDHMIKGTRAGNALRNVLMKIQLQPATFARAFNIKIDETKPLKFLDILKQISNNLKGNKSNVYDVAVAFENLGIRGTPAFQTLIEHGDELQKVLNDLNGSTKDLTDIENMMLDTLSGRWNQFKGALSEVVPIISRVLALKGLLKSETEGLQAISELSKGNELLKQWNSLEGGKPRSDFAKNLTQQEINILKLRKGALKYSLDQAAASDKQMGMSKAQIQMDLQSSFVTKKTYQYYQDINEILKLNNDLTKKKVATESKSVQKIKESSQLTKKSWDSLSLAAKEELESGKLSLALRIKIAELKAGDAKKDLDYQAKLVNKIKEEGTDIVAAQKAREDFLKTQKAYENAENTVTRLKKEQNRSELTTLDLKTKVLEAQKKALEGSKKITDKDGQISKINAELLEVAKQKNIVEAENDKLSQATTTQLKLRKALRDDELVSMKKQLDKEGVAREVKKLDYAKQYNNEVKKALQIEIKALSTGQHTATKEDLILEKKKQSNDIDRINAKMTEQQNELQGMSLVLADKQYQNVLKTSDAQDKTDKKKHDDAIETIRLAEIQANLKERLASLDKEKYTLKTSGASELELLDIDIQKLKVQQTALEQEKQITTNKDKQKDEAAQLLDLSVKLAQKEEERLKIAQPLLYVYQQMQQALPSFRESIAGWIKGTTDTATSGLATMLNNVFGGFSQANQQANDLNTSLYGYQLQKQELMNKYLYPSGIPPLGQTQEMTYKGPMSLEDVYTMQKLNFEIVKTRNEIDSLQNPLRNAEEAFKTFAKGVIDSITQIIDHWVAMQIATGIIGLFVGGNSFANDYSSAINTSGYQAALVGAAHGGILSQIKSFRAFSSGGITSNPTMAILGDNPSKKELVIPSENISNNSVSGYTRNKDQSITIINAITNDDITREISKPNAGKVIVNWVYKDKRNKVQQ